MSKQRYDAMMVREFVDGQGATRSSWTKIGSAFVNKDGSIGLALDAVPLDWTKSKIILQVPKTEEEIEALKKQKYENSQGGGQQQRRGGGPQRGFGTPKGRNQPAPEYPAQFDDHDEAPAQGFADDEPAY